jgi:ABC-type thiamine transport system ATPase subunit
LELDLLKIDNLSYSYDGQVYKYDLSCQKGEIVAVMGGSGSGKSTLLDLIAGFLDPFDGEILLDEKELLNEDIKDRSITILFQHDNLFVHLSVEKNLSLGVSGKKDIKKILKEVGLEGYESKLASDLSGGEAQRVAVARALLRESKIMLLDEPFSGLDEKNRLNMLEMISKITKDKKLHTILVTHNKDDVGFLGCRVYEMVDFRLREEMVLK